MEYQFKIAIETKDGDNGDAAFSSSIPSLNVKWVAEKILKGLRVTLDAETCREVLKEIQEQAP